LKTKVMVAMSGGVDSSVALLKVLESGYEAFGVTMKLWDYQASGGNVSRENSCCSVDEINGAKLVCDRMDVPHYTIDFSKVFRDKVMDNFAGEYLAGRTPNPCIRCNSFVKWDAFIQQADILGADLIATGHYARVELRDDVPVLKKGLDPVKDQAYVLWGIPRHTMTRTLLPLGNLTKPQVRQIAADNRLATATTPESMEICFIPDNNYMRFLREFVPDKVNAIGHGNIIEDHQVVGTHSGYAGYTVGQRKGLGLSNPEPRYVQKIDPETNTVFVSKKNALLTFGCNISSVNWLVDPPDFPHRVQAQIRYNSQPVTADLAPGSTGELQAQFSEPQPAVTPGQSIVFYDQHETDIVLGGGIIER